MEFYKFIRYKSIPIMVNLVETKEFPKIKKKNTKSLDNENNAIIKSTEDKL